MATVWSKRSMRCQTNDSGNRGGASGIGEEPSRYIVAQIAQ
jgi:hypothetical protein